MVASRHSKAVRVLTFALGVAACSRKSESHSRPIASTLEPTAASLPGASQPSCGLATPDPTELLPVFDGKVVVSRSLRSVVLQGAPTLIDVPSDGAEFYLAESRVAPASLPTEISRLRGASVRVVGAQGCTGRLGTIAARAWADEQGVGWRDSRSYNARRAFREGSGFLVADFESECAITDADGPATANVAHDLRPWKVRSLLEEKGSADATRLIEAGLHALESEPALTKTNATYEAIRRRSSRALPAHWWSLPGGYVYWSYATANRSGLLIAELSGSLTDEFFAAWLGVWCVAAGGSLISLGPDAIPDAHARSISFYHHRLSVVGSDGALPIVLYSYFALRPERGHYAFYDYSLPAAPLLP